MKKSSVIILILLISLYLVAVVSAQNETTIEDAAKKCIENKINDRCDELTLEELVFTSLSIGQCKAELQDKSKDDECWPSASCKIRDTALAVIALNHVGGSTRGAEDWLLDREKISADLDWYLEIDASNSTQCKISSGSTSKTITINEDKTISGNPGSCFSLAYQNYWLKIDSDCLKKNITLSCSKDFVSTLLYKKSQGDVWYLSPETESASAGGTTEHSIQPYCLSTSSKCDYEGSLWAVLALQKTEHNINKFLPYLIALAEDNEKLFPETFLYQFSESETYLQEIINQQETEGVWDLDSGKNKYYDTALALLSLPDSEAESLAKIWLDENQDNKGCWNNNVRDTGFLLWAGWPAEPVSHDGTSEDYCGDFGYYCASRAECDEASGNILENFYCTGSKICCDALPVSKTCDEQGGIICPSGQTCEASVISASDTDECCPSACVTETYECQEYGYNCRTACSDNEEETSLGCAEGKICCKEKEGGASYLWLWLLIILIVLVALAIIFRNRIRLWLFKLRREGRGASQITRRPPFPPAGVPAGLRRMLPSPMPRAREKTKTEKELEETLNKLREIGK
ncbi:MAG: hypothetical protein AABX71_01675 [Nanoarchaeota archaeon]